MIANESPPPDPDAWTRRADVKAFLREALRDSAEGRVQRFTRIALANYMRANAGD